MATNPKAPRKTPQSKELVTRTAKRVIHHDGEEYAPGDDIEMTVDQAEQLDGAAALEPVKATAAESDVKP